MKTFLSICCCLVIAMPSLAQAKKFADLTEIQSHFDEASDAAMLKLNKDRLAAIDAYVNDKANKDKTDLPKARAQAAHLRVEIVTKSDANAATLKDAHAKFLESLEKDGIQAGVGVTSEVVEKLVELDELEAAKAAWAGLLQKFGDHPQAGGQVKTFVEREAGELELIGKEPKAFNVKDMKDQELSLEKFKGKVVLIDFWATWCGPCIRELPSVIAAYKKYHSKGFEIIGVSLDKEDKTVLDKFLADNPDMTWPQFYDGKFWKSELGQLYGVQSIPATYLIDQSGKVYRVGVRGKALDKAIDKLLSKGGAAPPK
jgi:thiol-disulfide isomerase/thioredoxin